MPFLVVHKLSGEVIATIDRDDLPAWLNLVELPLKLASEYRTLPIPALMLLPTKRAKMFPAEPLDHPTPVPVTR